MSGWDSLRQGLDQSSRALSSVGLGAVELAALAAVLLCMTVPWIRIFKRAGFHAGAGILMLIPPINIFMFLLFAFHEWPIEKSQRTSGIASSWQR